MTHYRTITQTGSALVVVLLVLLFLTLLGAAALQMGQDELAQVRMQVQWLRATYLAESGLERVIGWFAQPADYAGGMRPSAGPCRMAVRVEALYLPRCQLPSGRMSFLAGDGTSQFRGSLAQPDGSITLPNSSLLPVWPDAPAGSVDLLVYGPHTPGAMATVEAAARLAGGAGQRLRVEIYPVVTPSLTAAAAAGVADPSVELARQHWGELRYAGDGRLPVLDDQTTWPYGVLKRLAQRYGRYYTTDALGRLYRDGQGPPLAPSALTAATVGALSEAREVVFVDSLDGRPPRPGPGGNLAAIRLTQPVHGVVVYLAGDLIMAPSGPGHPLTVPSPDDASGGTATLEDIDLSGGWYVAGVVRVETESRLYGAVHAAQGFDGMERLEIWYDRRLRSGQLAGWPVAARQPGSWQRVE